MKNEKRGWEIGIREWSHLAQEVKISKQGKHRWQNRKMGEVKTLFFFGFSFLQPRRAAPPPFLVFPSASPLRATAPSSSSREAQSELDPLNTLSLKFL